MNLEGMLRAPLTKSGGGGANCLLFSHSKFPQALGLQEFNYGIDFVKFNKRNNTTKSRVSLRGARPSAGNTVD